MEIQPPKAVVATAAFLLSFGLMCLALGWKGVIMFAGVFVLGWGMNLENSNRKERK